MGTGLECKWFSFACLYMIFRSANHSTIIFKFKLAYQHIKPTSMIRICVALFHKEDLCIPSIVCRSDSVLLNR